MSAGSGSAGREDPAVKADTTDSRQAAMGAAFTRRPPCRQGLKSLVVDFRQVVVVTTARIVHVAGRNAGNAPQRLHAAGPVVPYLLWKAPADQLANRFGNRNLVSMRQCLDLLILCLIQLNLNAHRGAIIPARCHGGSGILTGATVVVALFRINRDPWPEAADCENVRRTVSPPGSTDEGVNNPLSYSFLRSQIVNPVTSRSRCDPGLSRRLKSKDPQRQLTSAVGA